MVVTSMNTTSLFITALVFFACAVYLEWVTPKKVTREFVGEVQMWLCTISVILFATGLLYITL